MVHSTDFMYRSLAAWDSYAGPFSAYADVFGQLVVENNTEEAVNYLLGSVERYIQAYRLDALGNHWATVENLTDSYIARFELTPAESIKLNGLVGHYGIPRTFLFVYLHAKLLNELGQRSPWVQLQQMVEQLELPVN